VAANKITGVWAALITAGYLTHQGVEHDDPNVLCLGGRVTAPALAWDLLQAFLVARFQPEECFRRRLRQVSTLEMSGATARGPDCRRLDGSGL
jgi:ribose 5-phosphate isomerase B